MVRNRKILVFDSGIGGLTVYRAVRDVLPNADYVYAADDAAFPYGRLSEATLVERVCFVMDHLISDHCPDIVVVACNTASTLVLPHLRARFAVPFIGTVPAIKPAAQLSTSRVIAVLATPGTVSRDYTHELIRQFGGGCEVILVGSNKLAMLAEQRLRGKEPDTREVLRELEPCFVDLCGRRTDVIALSCTHYPLLTDMLHALSPWPVTFIDPAPAIAKRALAVLAAMPPMDTEAEPRVPLAVFTGPAQNDAELAAALSRFGLQIKATAQFEFAA